MIASKVSREVLESAARSIGVRAEVNTLNTAGTRHRVKLYPEAYADPENRLTARGNRRRDERGDYKYQRTSAGYMQNERRVFAVCWHGFRDYFRAVYAQTPDAVFRTAMDTWHGAADFEDRFRASGHRNIGPQIAPVLAAEACRCPSSGYAG